MCPKSNPVESGLVPDLLRHYGRYEVFLHMLLLCRALSSSHPAQKDAAFVAAAAATASPDGVQQVSLHNLQAYKATLAGNKKAGNLQYSDLHGVPCLLVLCEKGRMGDTFPQTFGCLDLRIRTSDNYTTFIQEIGRLCRYPAVSKDAESSPPGFASQQITTGPGGSLSKQQRLACLRWALEFAYQSGE